MKKYRIFTILTLVIMLMTIIPCTASNDDVVIGESGKPAVVITSANGNAGDEVELTLSLKNNPGICTMYLNIKYDEKLTLISAKDEGLLIGDMFSGKTEMNPYRLTWDDSVNKDNTQNGKLATLKFKIPENANPGDKYSVWITYNPDEIYNMDLENQYFEAGNAVIKVNGEGNKADNSVTNGSNDSNFSWKIIIIVMVCAIFIAAIVIVALKVKKRK